jgi:hypothetical protein
MTPSKLIQALTGNAEPVADVSDPGMTDPVFVEKLASAVDFISESMGSDEKVASPEEDLIDQVVAESVDAETETKTEAKPEAKTESAPVADLGERLRKQLHARIQAKKDATVEPDKTDETNENVLGKLLELRPSAGPDAEEAPETAPVAEDEPAEETDSAPADEEVGEKAASADLSLAEVLEGALQANELEEGVQELPKTASVRGVEGPKARKAAIDTLKKGLMAKFGKEA